MMVMLYDWDSDKKSDLMGRVWVTFELEEMQYSGS
jgi:hypothetical protein